MGNAFKTQPGILQLCLLFLLGKPWKSARVGSLKPFYSSPSATAQSWACGWPSVFLGRCWSFSILLLPNFFYYPIFKITFLPRFWLIHFVCHFSYTLSRAAWTNVIIPLNVFYKYPCVVVWESSELREIKQALWVGYLGSHQTSQNKQLEFVVEKVCFAFFAACYLYWECGLFSATAELLGRGRNMGK